jgi:hypothetical protein
LLKCCPASAVWVTAQHGCRVIHDEPGCARQHIFDAEEQYVPAQRGKCLERPFGSLGLDELSRMGSDR